MVHKFDAKKAGILDDPERVKILDPATILEKEQDFFQFR
jgi:hypothetical protein